jgi:cytoskeletal protein RodZ
VVPLHGCDLAWVWETCVLHAIGEQFCLSDSMCGVVLARRGEPRGDSLCLWNNDSTRSTEDMDKMREQLRATLKVVSSFLLFDVSFFFVQKLGPDAHIAYQPHKGHIDFNQQHPPLPPSAKRRSSRRTSKEQQSPSHSNRSSGAAPVSSSSSSSASAPAPAVAVAATPNATSNAPATVSYAAAASRVSTGKSTAASAVAPARTSNSGVAAVASKTAEVSATARAAVVRVTATMDVEHSQTVLALAPKDVAPSSPPPLAAAVLPHVGEPSPRLSDDDGSAAQLRRPSATVAPPTVLVVRRPRSPTPASEATASASVPTVALTASTKKGRARQKQEAAKQLQEQQKQQKEQQQQEQRNKRQNSSSHSKEMKQQSKLDGAVLAVAVIGIVVGLLSMWIIFRT